MLGPDFMIAPVLEPNVDQVKIYLYQGEWTHLWTRKAFTFDEGTWLEVDSPLGVPAVFYRSSSEWGHDLSRKIHTFFDTI
jgi:alpha-glucosidase